MDTSSTMDSFNDTPPLPPELSFEDFLDNSPVKRGANSDMFDDDDPLELEYEGEVLDSETLNTPKPKKIIKMVDPPATGTNIKKTAAPNAASTTTITTSAAAVTKTIASVTAVASSAGAVLLNNKNILAKSMLTSSSATTTTTAAGTNQQLIKITPKLAPALVAGKTAVKTANGQIIYIQKAPTTDANKIATNRIATSIGGSTASHTTVTGASGKTVSIQVIRAADGSLVPVKATTSSAATFSATAKKFISTSTGQQVVLKTPLKTLATTAAAAKSSSTSPTTTSTSSTTLVSATTATISTAIKTTNAGCSVPITKTATGKIVVQSASGKQIFVSNQNLIKLTQKTLLPTSPGAITTTNASSSTATATATSTTTSASAGKIQAIQIPGKGLQYVCVLPKSTSLATSIATAVAGGAAGGSKTINTITKLPSNLKTIFSNAVNSSSISSIGINSTTTATKTTSAAITPTTTTTTTATTPTSTTASTIKILNPLSQKFKIINANSAGLTSTATKIVFTQSPKKEGGATFSPVTTKVHKTVVALPSLRQIGGSGTSGTIDAPKKSPTTTTTSTPTTSSTQTLFKNGPAALSVAATTATTTTTTTNIVPLGKHKISEINSEIQRITTDESGTGAPVVKKAANGSRYILATRSMLRPGGTALTKLHMRPNAVMQRVMVQGASGTTFKNLTAVPVSGSSVGGSGSSKKLYSVLKSTSIAGQKNAVDINSLVVGGQTQESLVNQQLNNLQEQKAQLLKRHYLQQQQQLKERQQQQQPSTAIRGVVVEEEEETNVKTKMGMGTSTKTALYLAPSSKFVAFKIKEEPLDTNDSLKSSSASMLPPDDPANIVRRKHCNCSKSQCLKLYCDCFANGEFCQDCTCKDCCNNLQYEDERQRAIKNCLERNPNAFKPKITTSREQHDMRLHNKGCNCKRSGCLKNYCECYEAKIPCSSNCKCVGCRNVEDRPDLDMDPIDPKIMAVIANASANSMKQKSSISADVAAISALAGHKRPYDKSSLVAFNNKAHTDKLLKDGTKAIALGGGGAGDLISGACSSTGSSNGGGGQPPEKQQCNFITQDVIDATIQCMISQADECEKNGLPAYQTEKMVMEELGRCLVEIIDFSIRNTDTSFTQD